MDSVDLHTHTTHSDGTLDPLAVIKLAKEKSLRAIAITDHDTVSGVAESLKLGEAYGLEVIPAIEISARYKSGEIHILGYDIDWQNQNLVATLIDLRDGRNERNPQIVERLRALGFDIDYSEVKAVAGDGTVGRPHIAQVLLQRGHVASISEAFERFLKDGAIAYVPRANLGPERVVGLILEAGGIPVLAHPSRLDGSLDELEKLCASLVNSGLMGVEVLYSTHDKSQVELYQGLASKYGLLVTGGSDFHGANKPGIELGTGKGNLRVPYCVVEKMRQKRI